MSRFRRIVDIVGRVLIGAGVVLLLFTAYQLWGTSIEESHAQAALRTQLRQEGAGTAAEAALAQAAARDTLPAGPPRAAATTGDPAEGEPLGEIRIPAIGLDQVVVEGTGTADLRKGPGHYSGTPLPGQSGNVAIAGHRTTYGHPFYSLDALKVGDPVVVTTLQGVFVYDVTTAPFVVSPDDTSVLQNQFADLLTLTTCNPRYSATTRLIVRAALVHSRLFAAVSTPTGRHPGQTSHRTPTRPVANSLAGDSSVQVAATVAWGAALVALGVLVLVVARRARSQRWLVYGAGAAAALVLLWFFFGAVSPLLPASF